MSSPQILGDEYSPKNASYPSISSFFPNDQKEPLDQMSEEQSSFYQSFSSFRNFEECSIEGFKICEDKTKPYAVSLIFISFRNHLILDLYRLCENSRFRIQNCKEI